MSAEKKVSLPLCEKGLSLLELLAVLSMLLFFALSMYGLSSWKSFNQQKEKQGYLKELLELEKHLKKEGTSADILNATAIRLFKLGRMDEAESLFKQAIKSNKNFVPPLANLGSLYNNKKDYQKAEKVLIEAVALDPTNQSAWLELGLCFMRQEKLQESELALNKLLELNPNEKDGVFLRGYVRLRLYGAEAGIEPLKKLQELNSPKAAELQKFMDRRQMLDSAGK